MGQQPELPLDHLPPLDALAREAWSLGEEIRLAKEMAEAAKQRVKDLQARADRNYFKIRKHGETHEAEQPDQYAPGATSGVEDLPSGRSKSLPVDELQDLLRKRDLSSPPPGFDADGEGGTAETTGGAD